MTPHHALFEATDVALQCGRVMPRMTLSYKTFGTLAADKSNVILYPTSYSAQHTDIEFMVGPGAALDSSRYFVVILDLFGNGLSSSPSNMPVVPGEAYPEVTVYDAVAVQRQMLAEVFGIERIALVYGWSMGAMQAYHWAAMAPEAVERIAVVCGSARCAPHNRVFIEGAAHALMADPAYRGGGVFTEPPVRGFQAMGRVYAGWALSQTWYREELWRTFGATSIEDYLVRFWDRNFARRDAADLLAQFRTWHQGDISAHALYGGDLPKALGAIRARTLLMPGDHDLYFQVDDSRLEMQHLRHAELAPIPSVWGHRAGNPTHQPADRAFIESRVRALLAAESPLPARG